MHEEFLALAPKFRCGRGRSPIRWSAPTRRWPICAPAAFPALRCWSRRRIRADKPMRPVRHRQRRAIRPVQSDRDLVRRRSVLRGFAPARAGGGAHALLASAFADRRRRFGRAFFHIAYPQVAARFIGWADSPFQFEVGMADLAIGVAGCAAFRSSFGFRAAAVLVNAIFLLGDAVGHVRQMIAAGNFAPGNAGPVFYLDIILPALTIALLLMSRRRSADGWIRFSAPASSPSMFRPARVRDGRLAQLSKTHWPSRRSIQLSAALSRGSRASS